MKVERILVPTDFSECSKLALDYAILMAENLGAKIDLIHSIETPDATISYELVMDFLSKMHSASEKELKKEVNRIPENLRGERVLADGPSVPEILKTAKEKGSDIIVVGTHGRKGLAHLLLGSTTEKLIRHSRLPVLTIPPREE